MKALQLSIKQLLFFFLILFAHTLGVLVAAENNTNNDESPEEPRDNDRPTDPEEESNYLLDPLFDPLASRYFDESETLDSTDAVDRLMDKISDIRERQCFACIQGLGYLSDPDRDELLEILKSLIPREFGSIVAMRPLLV